MTEILEVAVFPDTGRVVPEIGTWFVVTGITENVLDFHDGPCTVVELSLLDSDSEPAHGDERRAKALAAREDWQRFDWDGAKPYKEHLRERLQTVEDYLGYLNACHEEGPETLALAVQDVLEFAATSNNRYAQEQIIRQDVADSIAKAIEAKRTENRKGEG